MDEAVSNISRIRYFDARWHWALQESVNSVMRTICVVKVIVIRLLIVTTIIALLYGIC